MEIKYSKNEFNGYTHRFLVSFNIGDNRTHAVNIYSNSGDYSELSKFINDKKSDKVVSFEIAYKASKEQDNEAAAFIHEVITNL